MRIMKILKVSLLILVNLLLPQGGSIDRPTPRRITSHALAWDPVALGFSCGVAFFLFLGWWAALVWGLKKKEPNHCLSHSSELNFFNSRLESYLKILKHAYKYHSMLSINTDENTRVDMRGHGQAGTSGKSVRIEPSAPITTKPSSHGTAPSRGRNLKSGTGQGSLADQPSTTSGKDEAKKRTRARTMEELDRCVENDALELRNMKKEIAAKQKLEVLNAMKALMAVKKEYDMSKAENNNKLAQVNKIKDMVISLKGVDAAVHQSSEKTANLCRDLTQQLADVEECASAESRTLAMQKLMMDRLVAETYQFKIESVELDFKAEKIRHDLVGVNNTLLISKTELGDREFKLDGMRAMSKARKKERGSRMQMLNSIVEDGQHSASLVRSSFFDKSPDSSPEASPVRKGREGATGAGGNSPDRDDFNFNLPGGANANANSAAAGHGAGSGGKKVSISNIHKEGLGVGGLGASSVSQVGFGAGAGTTDEDEDFETSADSPHKKAQRMTLEEIEEMGNRYQTRDVRVDKLKQLEADLKENLAKQKKKAAALTEEISSAKQKVAQLASTRQVYQDVENQTRALSAARKEMDDFKEKDYRLKVNLISLKRSIPRLLSKLTKIQHPIPTDLQLPDALARLTSEVMKYFKEISQSMLKDATPEEMVQMSRDDDEKQSQIDKLHGLPGFSKLQKELFFNMMGARPDNSSANVRVACKIGSHRGGEGSSRNNGGGHKASVEHGNAYAHGHHTPLHASISSKKKDELYGGPGLDSPVIDREMAKKISALVFQRDGKGVIPQLAKPKKKEKVKQKFVFRD